MQFCDFKQAKCSGLKTINFNFLITNTPGTVDTAILVELI